MNAITLRRVVLALGGRIVLDDISLDVRAGELVGVLGANGSGKTTLMRAVLGLVAPTSGIIEVLGRKATRGNSAIGYMPQIRGSLPNLRIKGRDLVASIVNGYRFGLPIPGKAGWIEVDRALDLVGARELAAHPLAEISGGERQRLLLAQALIGRPRLLLLDEPLISLDPRHQVDVVALVKRLQQELGMTVLFSAHEVNPLLGAIDRVLYLGHRQAALGTIDEVITGPVLSRLYDADIDVVRIRDRIFVMSGGHDLEHAAHQHEDRGDAQSGRRRASADHA
jgi:zinc/manganese transport system ATP-binding protein